MRGLVKIRLRTLVWLILPVIVLVVIPRCLLLIRNEPFARQRPPHLSPSPMAKLGPSGREPPPAARQVVVWLGVWLIVNGVGLAAWCVNLFNVEGRGTPLPLDPPKRFVASGPYRYVRNPMMLGAFLILGGEATVFQSWVLALYTLAIMVLAHLFVRCWEEPDLAHRFGQPYREYQQQVPRWIPRAIPARRKTS